MPPTPKRTYPWQRRRRAAMVWTALVLCLVAIPCLAYRWAATHQVQQAVQAIRTAGLPMTGEELSYWELDSTSPTDPESKKMALSINVTAAEDTTASLLQSMDIQLNASEENPDYFVKKEKLRTALEKINAIPMDQRLPNDLRELLREAVVSPKERLQRLHVAAAKPLGRFPIDYSKGYKTKLHHLPLVSQAVSDLSYEAWLATEDGDAAKTVEAIMAGLEIANTIRNDPFGEALTAYTSCLESLGINFYRALVKCTLDDASLARLGAAFQQAEAPEILTRILVGEQVRILDAYDHPENAEGIEWAPTSLLDDYVPGATNLLLKSSSGLGHDDYDKAYALRVFGRAIEISRLPSHEMFRSAQALQTELQTTGFQSWVNRPSLHLLVPISLYYQEMARNLFRIRFVVTAAAVERYRLIAHTPPNSLDTLVPSFLSAVPQDPYDGRPIRYRRKGNGYMIYSVGENLKDNQDELPSKYNYPDDMALGVSH